MTSATVSYELEDMVWDDICQCDDSVVPHPGDAQAGDRRQNKMLEKDGWSQKSDGVVRSSSNSESIKEGSITASVGARTSNHCFKSGSELCETNDSILNDKSAGVGNSFGYPHDHMSEADNDLSYFGSNQEEKDTNDLLYYNWADMGNFENVDQMFRNCDSTFGHGARNEDNVDWFSSSDAIGGSEDALKSEFKFSYSDSSAQRSVDGNHDTSRLNDCSGSNKKSNTQNSSGIYQANSWTSVGDELGQLSFSKGCTGSDVKDEFMPEGQIDEQKKQQKHQNQAQRCRNDEYLEDGSFLYDDNIPGSIQQQKQESDSDTYGYLRRDTPCMVSDYTHPSNQNSTHPTLSAVTSENSSLTCLSPKDSYTSNQVRSKQGSHDLPFQGTSSASIEMREKLHHQQGFQASFDNNPKNVDLAVQASMSGTTSMENLVYFSGDKYENQTDVEGINMGTSGESGSSVAQGRSIMNLESVDISDEATSFRQLRLVLEQLDLGTKLRIRDSLYRLARSAEQRHNNLKLNGTSGDERDANGVLLADATNKYNGLMDMETETNPMDRSMAHLLYHQSADTSVMPGYDSLSFSSATPAGF